MPQFLAEEAKQLRDDLEILGIMVDAALDNGLDHRLLDACASVMRERHERLEELERDTERQAA